MARRGTIHFVIGLSASPKVSTAYDDLKNYTEDVDKILSKNTDEVDKLFKEKEQEILSI